MSHLPPILVVEDSEDQIFLLRHAFEKVGILNPVQVVNSGEDAIAYLSGAGLYSDWEKFPLPSFILLDLKLPGLDGLEVLRWVRQQPGIKALRVAMLTSSDLGLEINACYEAGANVFLTKPMELNTFIEMMRVFQAHWLKIAQAPQVSRQAHTLGVVTAA